MNGLGKSMKIRHVMKLRHIGKKWRKLAGAGKVSLALVSKLLSTRSCRVPYVLEGQQVEGKKSASNIPPDVPSGHLAVYVGQKCSKRFVIRVAYLNHPVFRALLEQAKEQFGYAQQGGLAIPCDELLFEQILRLFTQNDLTAVRHLDLEAVKGNFCNEWHCSSEAKGISFGTESRSLLHAFAEKSVR